MNSRIAETARRLATDTTGAVAIIVALALPVLLGFGALSLEYGSSLVTKSQNQRTSDIAAYAAAFEYIKKRSSDADQRVAAARVAAEHAARLNGVSSGVSVSFDNAANATYVDVEISEEKPLVLSQLIHAEQSLTINTTSRVSLGQAGFVPCILALGGGKKDGFTKNGTAGSIELDGCGVGSNGQIDANGQTINADCAAPNFKKPGQTCESETYQQDFTNPFSDLTNWPVDSTDDAVCDFTGSFPDDLSTQVGGNGNSAEYRLRSGVLCVDSFSGNFPVVSDPGGPGSTLILKAGVDFEMKGNDSFDIKPPANGDFTGVAIYAPESDIVMSGKPDLSIDGFGCSGLVANSMTFNGNVTLKAECDEKDTSFGAGGSNDRPRLIR